MNARIAIVALALSIVVVSPCAAAPRDRLAVSRHDEQVIQFFVNHPRLARTAAGQRALWRILGHVVAAQHARSLQLVEASTWAGAVRLVGRYFGARVAAWELACSQTGSEGGWGRWFWNGGVAVDDVARARYLASGTVPSLPAGTSGAGGWLQFKLGTFESVIADAIRHARARGMFVPASARSWLSPLGQALAGAEMLADGRRGEWSGWAC